MNEEDEMRAIDCPCGHHFEAADAGERIAADAYEAATV